MTHVLKSSLYNNALCRGLKETVRCLDRDEAQICFLAQDCDESDYVALIKALCKRNNTPLIMHSSQKKMGEMASLCKIDKDGVARRVVRCSSCCISDLGEESPFTRFLFDYVRSQQ